ncbi:MAG: hypothetical protein M0P55_15470 [Clostridiales bacterium]|nr:hypothetical protein [Clostridiales bacterium]
MPQVTRKQYTRVMTENIDGMHDITFDVVVPPSTPTTVHETFTVPAGYVGVLRNVTSIVVATAVAGQANAVIFLTRTGQPRLVVFQNSSNAGLPTEQKAVSTPYNIIMPEGTELQACYSNYDGTGNRRVWLHIVIDLIRL